MRGLETQAVVLALVQKLRERDSWCGETHIQKAADTLRTLFADALPDLEFMLYKYGPYSFDLNAILNTMLADSFLRLESQPGYGPRFSAGETAWYLERHCMAAMEQWNRQLDFVAERVSPLNVKQLEPLATALMVLEENGDGDEQALLAQLKQKKPHVDDATGHWAIEEARKLRVDAKGLAA